MTVATRHRRFANAEAKHTVCRRLVTRLNGEIMQDCRTDNMVWSVARIIAFLSQETTLLPGSVILTGTPPGIGFVRKPPQYLRHGDHVAVEIEKIGTLYNHVVER